MFGLIKYYKYANEKRQNVTIRVDASETLYYVTYHHAGQGIVNDVHDQEGFNAFTNDFLEEITEEEWLVLCLE